MNRRGFTLIELAVTVAISAVLAVIAFVAFQATTQNTTVETTAANLAAQAQGLHYTALAQQTDYLMVVANPPGNDTSQCGTFSPSKCVQVFTLNAPAGAWTLSTFDPNNPGVNASFVSSTPLPQGTILDVADAGEPVPAPFQNAWIFAPDVTTTCANGGICIAVRFTSTGQTAAQYGPGGAGATKGGVAFGLTTDLTGLTAAAQRRAVLVSIPTGIVQSFAY